MRATVAKSLLIRGFIQTEFYAKHIDEYAELAEGWLADGRLKYREDITAGLENRRDRPRGVSLALKV
jgi:NADPH-dependent curcumin reductase